MAIQKPPRHLGTYITIKPIKYYVINIEFMCSIASMTSLVIGLNCHIATGWTQSPAILVRNLWPYYVSRSHAKKSQLHMLLSAQVCKISIVWIKHVKFKE